MVAAGGWTTGSLNDCGAVSSTKTSISTIISMAWKQGEGWPDGSRITTIFDLINPCGMQPQPIGMTLLIHTEHSPLAGTPTDSNTPLDLLKQCKYSKMIPVGKLEWLVSGSNKKLAIRPPSAVS